MVRVPLALQLERALEDGNFIAIKSLTDHLRGANATEAKRAVTALVDSGRARRVMRTTTETIVPPSADTLSAGELGNVAKRLSALAKRVQAVARRKTATALLRDDLAQELEGLLPGRP